MRSVLSIAGSDSSGGAGIQADIKTIAAHQLFAQTAITALTAQNTLHVTDIDIVDAEFVGAQIDAVFEDIRPDAVKTGMVPSAAIARMIVEKLREHQATNIVVDPVLVATSGALLVDQEAFEAIKAELLAVADIITPNLSEAKALTGIEVTNDEEALAAAEALAELTSGAVLLKGGHYQGDTSNDLLRLADGTTEWMCSARVDNPNTHGTGCTLSSAIACGLAQGLSMRDAVAQAKAYITGALLDGMDLGKGSGPLNHMWKYSS